MTGSWKDVVKESRNRRDTEEEKSEKLKAVGQSKRGEIKFVPSERGTVLMLTA